MYVDTGEWYPEWFRVFIAQIKCGFKILKPWYGCVIVDSCTLSDPYDELVQTPCERMVSTIQCVKLV